MSPDSWTHDLALLKTEKDRTIQVQLLQDYYNNLLAYPKWQTFLRKQQPPTLIVWGKNDPAFIVEGAKAYLKDLPNAELHLIDAGHFAVEEQPVEIGKYVLNFMERIAAPTRRSIKAQQGGPASDHSAFRVYEAQDIGKPSVIQFGRTHQDIRE